MVHSAQLATKGVLAYRSNAEPSVEEVLSDPIVRTLMASDNVAPELLTALHARIADLQAQLPPGATVAQ